LIWAQPHDLVEGRPPPGCLTETLDENVFVFFSRLFSAGQDARLYGRREARRYYVPRLCLETGQHGLRMLGIL